MAVLFFDQITSDQGYIGGKAFNLAILSQQGFPVPEGIVLTSLPEEGDWESIFTWWKSIDDANVAVRSSASDEDDGDVSFAGQNSTFLNVNTEKDFKKAVHDCFESINRTSSKAYRKHFLGQDSEGSMNVLIQKMVKPLFAGVYFSIDPRGQEAGDLIEFVEGLGESLVSGLETPSKIIAGNDDDTSELWKKSFTKELRILGGNIKEFLNKEIDVEWAIDELGKLHLLQARPITATYSHSNRIKLVEDELERIKKAYKPTTTWDGQTFSEWTGLPSYLTFSLFEEVFSKEKAFDKALTILGYKSFDTQTSSGKNSVLDRIMGRAYINLEEMCPLYFGDIPYTIEAHPRPHLKFDASKINLKSLLKTPFSIFNMMKVGWNLTSKRREWLNQCHKELSVFKDKMDRPLNPDIYSSWSDEELIKRFSKEAHVFSQYHQAWPLVLIILTESTMQSLKAIVKSVFGEEESARTIKRWMGNGLKTATLEMNNYFKRACEDPNKREFFMSRYGHRAAGELDLSNPRWIELPHDSFFSSDGTSVQNKVDEIKQTVEEEIEGLQSFKKTIILQEWKLLKELLQLREAWKMEILKPFAHIRFLANELGKRSELGNDIFTLSIDEIAVANLYNKENVTEEIKKLIKFRKDEESIFKLYSLPVLVSQKELTDIVNGDYAEDQDSLDGEPLSPGVVFGKVKVVKSISDVDPRTLDSNIILVAESTDPGWTPLFTKASGIIVAKGGILSHSAIVAREMGIPAISGIHNCTNRFKDGDEICLDGNNGHIRYELRS
jgi:phosphohistidine swiveling domain-containing protein